MEPVKIESKQTLSRVDAAAFLEELATQLKGDDVVELDRQGVHFEFGVPDQVELEVEVEEELLGGVVAQVGDLVLDGSLRSQLEQLRTSLVKE